MAINHVWQAEDYHHHSSVQNDAAIQLMQCIQLEGHEQILDVGCGDGKITAKMADRVPSGFVIGVDISSDMVNFACKSFPKHHHSNLTFFRQDAQQFNYCGKLDVVFTSFALQWLPNPGLFFKSSYDSLKSSGCVAATIPLGISAELEKAVSAIISFPEWSAYFQTFSPPWYFLTENKYKQLLVENRFMPIRFNTLSQAVIFPSREDFEKYVIPWFSYLNPLPQDLKQLFLKQVVDKYLDISASLRDGEVSFSFPRLDLIAKKITL